jgi:hypothetical protein
MCASLGIRARLQPAASPPPVGGGRTDPEEDGPVGITNDDDDQGVSLLVQDPDAERAPGAEKKGRQKRMVVWALDGPSPASSASTQGLSF